MFSSSHNDNSNTLQKPETTKHNTRKTDRASHHILIRLLMYFYINFFTIFNTCDNLCSIVLDLLLKCDMYSGHCRHDSTLDRDLSILPPAGLSANHQNGWVAATEVRPARWGIISKGTHPSFVPNKTLGLHSDYARLLVGWLVASLMA